MSLEDQMKNAENWFADVLRKKVEEHTTKILGLDSTITIPKFEDTVLTIDTLMDAKKHLNGADFERGPFYPVILCDAPEVPEYKFKTMVSMDFGVKAPQPIYIPSEAWIQKEFDEIILSFRQQEIRKDMEFLRQQGTNFNSRAGYRKAYKTACRARERADAILFADGILGPQHP